MKVLGALLVLVGIVMLVGLVVLALPPEDSSLENIETDSAAWLGMAFAIVGAIFLVGSSISAAQTSILQSLSDLISELRRLERKLDNIRIAAKHSVQEFLPRDQISKYKGYEIYYRDRYYYIRDVNAKFFTQIGAESWIDKTTEKS